jgi:hypothetical protein
VSDERPNLAPLSPTMSGRGLPLPPRILVVSVIVALVAFAVGLQVNPTNVLTLPAPSGALPSATPQGTPLTTSTPTMTPTPPPPTPVVPSTPLPVGIYHVTQRMANEIAIASRFYAAYNAGQLAVEMSLLSPTPQLVDCDYMTHALVTVAGRSAIAIYLRARFAEHDHCIVEFYNENPANDGLVLALPLQRTNDTLRRLGAAGGVKSSFPVDFHLAFSPDGLHIESIGWDTMPGDATALCSP